MEDGLEVEDGSAKSTIQGNVLASINSEYAVLCTDGHMSIRKIAYPDEEPQHLPLSGYDTRTKHVLNLSPTQPNLLAISAGSQTFILDVDTRQLKSTISGIGRVITALSWSPRNANVLATGCIDGSICIWDLNVPSRPLRLPSVGRGPCHVIAFSPIDDHVLASGHGGTLSIWDSKRHLVRPICITNDKQGRSNDIAWASTHAKFLVAATPYAELRLYDASDVLSDTDLTLSSDSSEDGECDGGVSRKPDGTHGGLQLLSATRLNAPLRRIELVNDNTIFALTEHGREASVYEVSTDEKALAKLWSCELPEKTDAIAAQIGPGNGLLFALGLGGVDTYDIPVSVLKTPGSQYEGTKAKQDAAQMPPSSLAKTISNTASAAQAIATMKPISISAQREGAPGFAKTSKQLQRRRLSTRTAMNKTKTRPEEPSTPPATRSMNSSLELPKPDDEDIRSPMPFLSPSIPSRKFSPSDITPLDDSIFHLPPLPDSSFDTSVASTVATASDGQESDDSDDETFVDAMQGSATFLPGGINVPLPKACGALFAPNGQLLTFFPPKPRPASAREATVREEDEPHERRRSLNKVARLFPTFGNLAGDSLRPSEDSDSEVSSSFDERVNGIGLYPSFVLQPSSFSSQQSWKFRISPTKPGFVIQQSQHKVVVSVYEIDDVPRLFPEQRKLAETYRIMREDDESGADVCEHNASAADAAGLRDAAHIWRLSAMLLDDRVPLEVISRSSEIDDVLVVARRAQALTRTDSGIDIAEASKRCGSYGKLRWAGEPFGGSWLVRRILEWAEERGDTQMLACLSAILVEASETLQAESAAINNSFLERLSTHSLDYLTDSGTSRRQAQTSTRSIPILRTSSVTKSPSMYESPIKLQRSSNSSSRNPSHPPTPYLDSTSSTPTFSLPSLSRQGTRLSNSGSASPEYHRSSFSAAAKYYAQSITDKFASYGTSPPTKKSSTSPNMSTELSSSLPSGSWSKSVSFAASSTTANTTRGSLLSRSFDDKGYDDAYDSDKTVDDNSLPHTPKTPSGIISVVHKNQQVFDDDVSGSAKTKLVPEDLAAKGYLWCQYYAEQLRSWNLLVQAAELEKVSGTTNDGGGSSTLEATRESEGVLPIASKGQSNDMTCAICLNIVRRMEQICPSCHHISHLSCLEDYSTDLADADFMCPTSCGCSCSELAFVVQDWQSSPQAKPTFRKKASFTDPRRWRARVEGDSW